MSQEKQMGVFNDTVKEYGLGSGEKLKLAEGQNKIRVLSEPRMITTVRPGGDRRTQFVCWVIDPKRGRSFEIREFWPDWRARQDSNLRPPAEKTGDHVNTRKTS